MLWTFDSYGPLYTALTTGAKLNKQTALNSKSECIIQGFADP